jgi:geranylgeranyl pyrophosphate synthase
VAPTDLQAGSLTRQAAELEAAVRWADAAPLAAVGQFGQTLGVRRQMFDDLGGIVSRKRAHELYEDVRKILPWSCHDDA